MDPADVSPTYGRTHVPIEPTTCGSSSWPTVFWWNLVGLVSVSIPPAVFTGPRGRQTETVFLRFLGLRHPAGAPAGTR